VESRCLGCFGESRIKNDLKDKANILKSILAEYARENNIEIKLEKNSVKRLTLRIIIGII